MKKTLTIQLGRSIYPIDEDAYALLEQYLKDYQAHFNLGEADEKMRQLEVRIAEFFSAKRDEGVLVVSFQEMEEVIQKLHESVVDEEAKESQSTDDYEEIDAEECTAQPSADEPSDEAKSGTADQEARATEKETHSAGDNSQTADGDARFAEDAESPYTAPATKKLYRNPRDKMVGGVLSGFAAYMGWEVTAVRLVMVLLAFMYLHFFTIVYVIAWLLIPMAPDHVHLGGERRAAGCEGVEEDISMKSASANPTFLQSFCHGLAWIFAWLFKFLLVILGLSCLVIAPLLGIWLMALILGSMGFMVAVPTFIYTLLPSLSYLSINPVGGTLLSIAAVFIIGIPLVALGYAVMHRKNGKEEWSASVRLTLLILWIIAWIVAGAGLFIGIIP